HRSAASQRSATCPHNTGATIAPRAFDAKIQALCCGVPLSFLKNIASTGIHAPRTEKFKNMSIDRRKCMSVVWEALFSADRTRDYPPRFNRQARRNARQRLRQAIAW